MKEINYVCLLEELRKLKYINMCTVQQLRTKNDYLLFDYPKIFGLVAISHSVPAGSVFLAYKLGIGTLMAAAVLHSLAPHLHITSVILVQATDGGLSKYVNLKLPSFGIFPSLASPAFVGGHMSVGSHFTSQSVRSSLIRLKRVKLSDLITHPFSPLTTLGWSFFTQLLRRKQSFLVPTKDQNLHLESA